MKVGSKLCVLVALACGSTAETASAQEYLPAATAQAASGLEGGGSGFSRARTRIRIGVELRVDESPENGVEAGGIFDLEPRTAFAGELRYVRTVTPKLAVSGGAIGYFVPALLFGPCAGAELRLPLMKKTALAVGPEFAVFALGTDLPDRTVIWQALVQVGVRFDLSPSVDAPAGNSRASR